MSDLELDGDVEQQPDEQHPEDQYAGPDLYVLFLAKTLPPHNVMAVARSSSSVALLRFLNSQMAVPRPEIAQNGTAYLHVFAADGPLDSFDYPNAEGTGIICLTTPSKTKERLIGDAVREINSRVDAEWASLLANTVLIPDNQP